MTVTTTHTIDIIVKNSSILFCVLILLCIWDTCLLKLFTMIDLIGFCLVIGDEVAIICTTS